MLSYTFMNSHSQVSDSGPKGPLVYFEILKKKAWTRNHTQMSQLRYNVLQPQPQSVLTLREPPIICNRQQFQILLFFFKININVSRRFS